MRVDGQSLDIVTHFPFITEKSLKSTLVDNFRKCQKNDIKILIKSGVILKLIKKPFKLTLLVTVKTNGKHSNIIVLLNSF